MTVQPSGGFKPINHETNDVQGPSTSVLTKDQKQNVGKKWDDTLDALEKPLKDLVKELKTAKGADLKLVEKKINEFEKKIHDLQQNIKNELSRDLTPEAKKRLEAKWTDQLKSMEESFVKDLPKDQKEKFDEKWQEILSDQTLLAAFVDQKQTAFMSENVEMAALQQVEGTSTLTAASQIRELIKASIETLAIDEKGGALMTLSQAANVPTALQGANLTLSTTENGFSIHFGNLSPEKAQMAVDLMRQNPDEMARFLQSLNVSDLRVGDITVYQAPQAPTPYQAAEETARERGEGRREGGGGGREGGGEGGREGQEKEGRGR